jgi:hypothetical protein
MWTKSASAVRVAAAAIGLTLLTAAAGPYVTPPKRNAYVPVLPLPSGGSLHDILVRNGKPVGEQDPITPNDPSVRILHGAPYQAKALFEALGKGGTPVPSAIGSTVKLPDGSTVTYYENAVEHGSFKTIGNVEIFVAAKDVPVSQLRFYIPPYAVVKCPPGTPCDGGGGM